MTAAVVFPLLVLAVGELVLRLGGVGYPTDFFKRARIAGRDCWVANNEFGLRFFPASLARIPLPVILPLKKAPDTFRIFIFGESAAQGDPRPNFGAGAYLEALLRARYPETKFEVVNTAVTAINSHALVPIARQCARLEGDVWIVYAGNNEMVGPFGAATVFGQKAPPLWLVRLSLWLRATRLGQVADRLGHLVQREAGGPSEWQGMQMFLQNQVFPKDPRKEVVYRNFERNLEDLLTAGLDSGAEVVLSTVAVNLKDCSPFGSWPTTNLPPSERTAFEQGCREAAVAWTNGDLAGAAGGYQAAARVCPQSAEVQYRLGQCLILQTNTPAGRQHLQQALDADTLPFRADSRINETLKAIGRKFAGRPLALCDAAAAVGTASPNGVAGAETFFEHVHLNFTGNYLLARAWAAQMQELPSLRSKRAAGTAWLSQDECERRLGLTDWNRVSVWQDVAQRLREPPFINRFDNGQQLAAVSNAISQCRARMQSTPATEAARVYESALAAAPQDYRLHENFAEFLEARKDPRELAERQKVCELVPHVYFPYYELGLSFKEAGRLAEAISAFQQAAALNPAQGTVRLELGATYARDRQWEAALAQLELARQLSRADPRPCLYLGEVLWKLNRGSESLARLQQAIARRPDYWEAHYRLGEELAQMDQVPAAAAEFEQVLRFNPGYLKAHLNLGVALAKLGRPREAVAQFDEVLRLDPQNQQAAEFRRRALREAR